MKALKYLVLLSILTTFIGCSEDDQVTSSGENLFPPRESSEIDLQLAEMFKGYNTRVEYLYVKNLLPADWYYITPVKEELVVPMSQLVLDMWAEPMLAGASQEFVSLTFPKLLVYVGSPAMKLDGTRILGQAEGGTLIRFTEVNQFDSENIGWINMQMHTAYHEYGHVIHQRFGLPNEYRKVTPDSYTLTGWRTVTPEEALRRGMVSPYGTMNPQEDFVELFSTYIIASDQELYNLFEKEHEGRPILNEKLSIQKKYMTSIGIDMDAVRAAYQARIAEIEANLE